MRRDPFAAEGSAPQIKQFLSRLLAPVDLTELLHMARLLPTRAWLSYHLHVTLVCDN
jgi:hypothetical protein